MKKIIYVLVLLLHFSILHSQPQEKPKEENQWTGTTDQKIWGLMTIWAQTKFAFPHQDRLREIDWDNKVREFIPKVIEANDIEAYYKTLMELIVFLRDSHTEIIPPWGRFTPGFDIPPVEVKIINDKFYIVRTGDNEELQGQKVFPGTEILEVDDGIPVMQFFQDNVLKYHTRGPKHADQAVGVFYLFYGPKGTKVQLKVRNTNAKISSIELTRNATTGNHQPFFYTFVQHIFAKTIEHRMMEDNILYINLPNFEGVNKKIRDDFLDLIDKTDLAGIKGMIIDLRYNLGGSHNIMHPIVSCLIDSTVKTPLHHYLQYSPAPTTWGKNEAFVFKAQDWEVNPRDGKRYLGPLVILMGATTHSSGEDMIIELSQTGRCMTIGEATAGGAGGRFPFSLPGGGEFKVSTFKATFPDGKEYMETGIQPDVPIQPTIKDIIQGKDVVLEKALEVMYNWQSFWSK